MMGALPQNSTNTELISPKVGFGLRQSRQQLLVLKEAHWAVLLKIFKFLKYFEFPSHMAVDLPFKQKVRLGRYEYACVTYKKNFTEWLLFWFWKFVRHFSHTLVPCHMHTASKSQGQDFKQKEKNPKQRQLFITAWWIWNFNNYDNYGHWHVLQLKHLTKWDRYQLNEPL